MVRSYMLPRVVISALIGFGVACGAFAQATAHPLDGYEPRELRDGYGTDSVGLGPEFSINELYFVGPFPDPSTLTNQEKYMIAGAREGPWGAAFPWYQDIWMMVRAYYAKTGEIPERISPDMVRAVWGTGEAAEKRLPLYTSPLTNEFPRLQADEFSPGDLYIRPLSIEEKEFFAQWDPKLDSLLHEQIWFDPIAGRKVRAAMDPEVFYVRVYGWSEVILVGYYYAWYTSD
ncbi:hypothetical protein IIA79_03155 [bacterium]|nr:hypothetical protein [bacterium]